MPDPAGRPTTPPTSGRRRLHDALLRPSREQVVVGVLLAGVGFAAITAVRSYQVDDTYAGYREQALVEVLNGLAGTTQRAQAEIARLEGRRSELLSSTSARQAALAEARERAGTLAILAGTVPVTGPGIRITIEETDGTVDIGSLLDTIQELRTAGAEAMQFNGEVRMIAGTPLADAVGGIFVDDVLVSPPYVIDVIGDPAALADGLTYVDGPIDQLESDGATIRVQELRSIDIESVRPAAPTGYAGPDGQQ